MLIYELEEQPTKKNCWNGMGSNTMITIPFDHVFDTMFPPFFLTGLNGVNIHGWIQVTSSDYVNKKSGHLRLTNKKGLITTHSL